MAWTSALVTVIAVLSLVAYAFATTGYPVRHTQLHDDGVWVSTNKLSEFGRINKAVGQFDGTVPAPGGATGEAELDILQDGSAVVGWDRSAGALLPIGVTGLTLGTDAKAGINDGALVSMAGGTLAVLDPRSGALWALRYSPDASLGSLVGLDRSAPKTVASVGPHSAMTVGPDGVIHAVSAAKGLTAVRPTATGFSTATSQLATALPGSLSITAVGAVPVILAQAEGATSATLLVRGTDPVTLPAAAKAVLQQPGAASSTVLLASSSALFSVSLGSRPVASRIATPAAPGDPAAPVQLRGCTFAAWSGAPGSTAAGCGAAGPQVAPLVSPTASLVFRVNRQRVLLNDRPSGGVWDLDHGSPAELDDWSKIRPPVRPKPKGSINADDQPGNSQNKPPTAVKDDPLGARAGRTTPLYVLDNDSDPAGKVLTVASISQPSSDLLSLAPSPDGQTVLVTLPRGARGVHTFTYTNSDGGPKTSSPAQVTVRIVPDDEFAAPTLRPGYADRDWATPVNGSVTIPVLNDWRNRVNGDPSTLVAAKASAGSVITTAQGDLVYSAPDTAGPQRITYTVGDGGSAKVATKTLHVNVQPDSGHAVPALAQNDVAQGLVGQPLVIHPLDNDLPGSDPATANATLSLAGTVAQPKNLRLSTDAERGTITVTPRAPGPYLLSYRAGYGTAAPSKPAQIRLVIHPRATGPILTGPDSAVLHGQAPLLVDVLANDYDPSGNLLDVVSATADVPLQIAIVGGRWLRINATQDLPSAGGGRIHYTVSDGVNRATGQVTVSELPAVPSDQPVTRPDFATVRAGGSTTIAVLDNDVNAGGSPITLAQNVGGKLAPGQLAVSSPDGTTSTANGTAYVSGNLVRYVAPAAAAVTNQRQVRITYRAQAAGVAADGTAIVTITPPVDAKANPNQTPAPLDLQARVAAGGTVTIPVPTSGVDPDGDTVTVAGLGPVTGHSPSPQLGRLLSYTGNSLTYQAYPYQGNGGTDQLSYLVADPWGATATATLRIAVIPPDVLPAPIPHPIAVTAAPGEHLRLHAISAAFVDFPDGDPPKLQDPVSLNAGGPAPITLDKTPGWLNIQVPQRSDTGTVTLVYGVVGDLGQATTAPIVVTIKPGFHPPPVVVDQFARLSAGATSVKVDLLKGDSDPAGGTLSVLAPAGTTGGMLTVSVTAHPQVLPYVVKSSSGAQATANVYIPAGLRAAPYWNGKTIDLAKGSVTIAIKDYVTDPQRKPLRLGRTDQIWPSPSIGLSVTGKRSADHLTLTAAPHYNGPAAVSFLVSNGAALTTADAQIAIITVPVQVGARTPVLRCPSGAINVVQGAPSGTPINIAAQCHVWQPDPAAGPLNYRLSWKGNPIPDVSLGNNDQPAPVVLAGHNARAGAKARITVTATGTSATAEFTVAVVAAARLTVSPIAAVGVHAGSTQQINIGAYVSSPFGRGSVSVVSVSQLSGGAASAATSGKQAIAISPHDNVSGTLVFRYVVTDVDTGDATRQVSATISLQVIDKPGAPTVVTPRPGIRSHEAIITWVAPDAHGSPIDGYTAAYTGPGARTVDCPASPCTITGLKNGSTYRFTVRAHNAVDYGPYSEQSGPDMPNAPPPPVTGFSSSQQLDHQITLAWNADRVDGSPVDHYTISWPGGTATVPGTAVTTTIHRLSNAQTTFRIIAFNVAGHSVATSTTGWPTGSPAAPTGLRIDYANDTGSKTRTVVLSWDPDSPNGQGPTRYAVTRSGSAVVCAEHQPTQNTCTDQPPVGQTYTYQVSASNQPGVTDPQHHTSPPASIDYEVAATPDQMDPPVAHSPTAADPDGYATVSFTTSASNGKSSTVHCAYTSDGSAPSTGSASCGTWNGYSPAGGTTETKSVGQLPIGQSVRFAVWEDNGSNTGGQDSAGSISGPSGGVVTNGPPSAPPNGSCNRNGTSLDVSWSSATATGSRTIVSYRVSLDNGGLTDVGNVNNYSYGGRPADGTGHSVQVYAWDGQDQGPGLNITGPNCSDPPPPTPVLAWGGRAPSANCNTDTSCTYVNLSVSNFAPGTYTVKWYDDHPDNGVWFTDTITVRNDGTGSSINGHWFGYGSKHYAIWVTVNGVRSVNTLYSDQK